MARTESMYSEYIIIETGRPFYTVIDMYKDPEMAKLKEAELAGTLPEQKNPTVQSKAGLFQKPGMLMEDYFDDETGDRRARFKDSVVLAEGDERGRIFIPKTEKELAKRIIKVLLRIDKTVTTDPASVYSMEEIMGTTQVVNKGGRPKRQR